MHWTRRTSGGAGGRDQGRSLTLLTRCAADLVPRPSTPLATAGDRIANARRAGRRPGPRSDRDLRPEGQRGRSHALCRFVRRCRRRGRPTPVSPAGGGRYRAGRWSVPRRAVVGTAPVAGAMPTVYSLRIVTRKVARSTIAAGSSLRHRRLHRRRAEGPQASVSRSSKLLAPIFRAGGVRGGGALGIFFSVAVTMVGRRYLLLDLGPAGDGVRSRAPRTTPWLAASRPGVVCLETLRVQSRSRGRARAPPVRAATPLRW
ncbi:Bax inhibitor-1/YccA family membrane protein [Actinoallomurus bryophytorum]|uniref:Bax inhibitor-1/YccA family membrane protein n=1 Tax=Actinoallomurus bryophytorum TaxID=1490222 RepID=UPI003CCC8874